MAKKKNHPEDLKLAAIEADVDLLAPEEDKELTQEDLGFEMPKSVQPAPDPNEQSVPNWVGQEHGSPSAPVKLPLGWAAGGKIKFTLCPTNGDTSAPGCAHYNAGRDLCELAAPEVWRSDACQCINYRAK